MADDAKRASTSGSTANDIVTVVQRAKIHKTQRPISSSPITDENLLNGIGEDINVCMQRNICEHLKRPLLMQTTDTPSITRAITVPFFVAGVVHIVSRCCDVRAF